MVASEFINCAKLDLRLPEFPCNTLQTYTQAGLWRSLRAWKLLPNQCHLHHKSAGRTKGVCILWLTCQLGSKYQHSPWFYWLSPCGVLMSCASQGEGHHLSQNIKAVHAVADTGPTLSLGAPVSQNPFCLISWIQCFITATEMQTRTTPVGRILREIVENVFVHAQGVGFCLYGIL